MHQLLRTTLASLLAFCIAIGASAQLSPADSSYAANLKNELTLADVQVLAIDSILKVHDGEIILLDKETQRIARSSMAQEEKESQQSNVREKKKLSKENRDLSIQLLLTSEQRKIYDLKIKPQKPSVLHMGMNHDRANCTVCIPK